MATGPCSPMWPGSPLSPVAKTITCLIIRSFRHACTCHLISSSSVPKVRWRAVSTTAHSSQWDLWAVVETARHLTFGTQLELIRWQVQACLNERMIKQVIVFATGDKGEPGHIGEHGPVAILSVETQQRTFLRQGVGRQIPTNGGESLTQFLPIPPVPAIAKRAQPLITVCL